VDDSEFIGTWEDRARAVEAELVRLASELAAERRHGDELAETLHRSRDSMTDGAMHDEAGDALERHRQRRSSGDSA
jgi:hypothetical protein